MKFIYPRENTYNFKIIFSILLNPQEKYLTQKRQLQRVSAEDFITEIQNVCSCFYYFIHYSMFVYQYQYGYHSLGNPDLNDVPLVFQLWQYYIKFYRIIMQSREIPTKFNSIISFVSRVEMCITIQLNSSSTFLWLLQ